MPVSVQYVEDQLWTWGTGSYGELGTGNSNSSNNPVREESISTNWNYCSSSHGAQGADTYPPGHTVALKTDNTLWAWGGNTYGELGLGDTDNRSTPVQIPAPNIFGWKPSQVGETTYYVSAGRFHTLAMTNDNGPIVAWGRNNHGQLGLNDTNDRSSPTQVGVLGNWNSVSCGYGHSAAIKNDGSLWLWGRNTQGQLGDGSLSNSSSPIQTSVIGTTWKQVSCGIDSTAAIKTDGTLWIWGYNNDGLGNGGDPYTAIKSPVQTAVGGTNWKQVAVGDATIATKTDGTLWCWGETRYLPDESWVTASTPTQFAANITNWNTVEISAFQASAITVTGELYVWGGYSMPTQMVQVEGTWKSAAPGNNFTTAIGTATVITDPCCTEIGSFNVFSPNTIVMSVSEDGRTFTVNNAPVNPLTCGTILKSTLFGNYVQQCSYDQYSNIITVSTTTKLYPGMAVQITIGDGHFPDGTYVTDIIDDTHFQVSAFPDSTISDGDTITGTPQIYVTEYNIQEATPQLLTAKYSAKPTANNIKLTAAITNNSAWPRHSVITGEKRLIELFNKDSFTCLPNWTTTDPR